MKLSTSRWIVRAKGAMWTVFLVVIVPLIIKRVFKNTDSSVITGLVQAAATGTA